MFRMSDEYYELGRRIKELTPEEQLQLAEEILYDIRRRRFTDEEARRQAVRDELAALLAREAAERAAQNAAGPNRVAG